MSDEEVRAFKYHGVGVRVVLDPRPESPREWDNLGTMVCCHSRYNLGDEQVTSAEDVREILERKDLLWLPLYLYDHSGLTMSTKPFSCPWDSGQVGIIYVEHKKVLKDFRKKRLSRKLIEKAKSVLRCEVKMYDEYLRGDVYGYIIGEDDDEDRDSCWGFYGLEYCIEEAKRGAVCIAKQRKKLARKRNILVGN